MSNPPIHQMSSSSSVWSAIFRRQITSNMLLDVGHNDGGSPATSDRASVYGEGNNTQTVTLANGTVEVVQTWPT